MKLRELEIGKIAIVKNISLNREKTFKLLNFGCTKGSIITCKFKNPNKTSGAYKVNGCVFAMASDDAEQVEVALC